LLPLPTPTPPTRSNQADLAVIDLYPKYGSQAVQGYPIGAVHIIIKNNGPGTLTNVGVPITCTSNLFGQIWTDSRSITKRGVIQLDLAPGRSEDFMTSIYVHGADDSWFEVTCNITFDNDPNLSNNTYTKRLPVLEPVLPTATPEIVTQQEKGIVFELDDEIFVMNADGTNLTRLTDNSVPDWDPAWSPTGDRIVFSSKMDGHSFDLYIMNADGSSIQRLTTLPNEEWDAAWSPDSTQIAFSYGQINSSSSEIYVINTDGSGLTRLTEGGLPTWSPDGTQIAYMYNVQIFVMNADGSGIRTLTSQSPNMFPAWSPDGQRIAFQSIRDGNPEIYVMNADGSSQTNLTNHPAADTIPTWSPDGQGIAFVSNRNGTEEIFVMNADGSDVTQLNNGYEPDW
jgi:Tol biopolymer transport system component